ncbi:MAG: SurA N-terminal domain-containing protein [Magnetospirillum sp. WYHS-4]
MLDVLRTHSKSIVIKILFGILILSFAAWGVGDMIRVGAGIDWIAEVGPAKIGPNELHNEVQAELSRLQQALGPSFDKTKLQPADIAGVVLQRLIDRKLLTLAANELGVAVPDDVISARIRADKTFHNKAGQFDRFAYEQILRDNGLNEDQFVAMMRGDLTRAQFLESMVADAGPTVAPKAMAEALFRHRFERRAAEVVRIADAAMPEPAAPAPEALAKFHQDSAAKFTAPEYRALTVLRLDAADLMGGIEITEAQAKESFEQRAAEFVEPEKRNLLQMILGKEEDARKAFEMVAKGADFAQVAKDVAGQPADALALGMVTRDDLLAEIADAAFQVDAGGIVQPTRSALGWHVLKVVSVQTGRQTTFEEARAKVTQEARRDKAAEVLFDMANKIEDKMGGGATIEDAGKAFGAKVVKIAAIDAQGNDPSGAKVTDLPPGKAFLETAFATGPNQDSGLVETGHDGFFLLRVDGVTPPALKPLDQVRDAVLAQWKDSERARLAAETAAQLAAAVQAGKDMAAAAKELGYSVGVAGPFTREGVGVPKEMPADLAARLFELKVGDVAEGRGKGGSLVARLKEIQAADVSGDAPGVQALRTQVAGEMRNDISQQLAEALRKRFPVSINNAGLKKLYEPRS